MTPERLEEIKQFATRFGCANCWTGTVGTACAYLRELLDAIAMPRRRKPISRMTKREFRDYLLAERRRIIAEWEQCNRDARYWNEHVRAWDEPELLILPMPEEHVKILDGVAAQLIVLDAELGIETKGLGE